MSQPVFGLQLGFHLNTISISVETPTHHISGCYSSHWGLALVHIQQIFHLEMPEGLVPDLQSLIFLPFTDKLCCLPRYSATSGSPALRPS